MSLFKMFFLADTATDTTEEVVKEPSLLDTIFNFEWGLPGPLQGFINKCIEVVVVIIILLILCKIVDGVTKSIRKRMTKRGVDKTVTQVVYYLANKIVKLLLLLMAIALIGIDTSSLVGLFTAAGLGISLAVQGTLANFAGGILILVLRPFKVDDFIECQGTSGTVEDIRIFYTYLKTADNKVVLVPNGSLIGGNIINYSTKPTRRIALDFSIDYSEDFKRAEDLILKICNDHELVLDDPAASVRISSLADSAVILCAKVWVKNGDYWTVTFDLLEQVYAGLVQAGIKIPYNQLEISYREALAKQEEEKGNK